MKKKIAGVSDTKPQELVLVLWISVLRQKIVIICATRAGSNLGILTCKISVLRQKLVNICATRAGAIFDVLACRISVLR